MGTYGKWDEKHLQMAVTAYKNSDYGLNECGRVYGVPKATVKRHAYNHHFVPSETLEVDENVADEPTSSKGLKRTYERYSEGDTSGDDSRESKKFKKTLNELSPLPKASKLLANRGKGKAQSAVLITSSPYKLKLEQCKNQTKKVKPMKTSLFSDEQSDDQYEGDSSWFYVLCGAVKEEDMIQCMSCRSWVHTRCAKVKPCIKNIL
ncbi:hypothetical protein J437_LFUL003731 [Ladona fulva]|uniref:Uncharacterized protein n=1 Tax=Ladona fulva TaxID=123851 RepID=A0A8K0NXZ0_LADFU|nr:hypothetical protein J437_LFUL003731 [Ladona fulva]